MYTINTGFVMSFILISIFFIIALLYSSVGFGGGSSYIAFMFLFNIPYEHIPVVALVCNLIVVSSGSFYFIQNKEFSFRRMLPYLITSIPAAYVAGMINIPKDVFRIILGLCLLLAGLRMFLKSKEFSLDYSEIKYPHPFLSAFIGLILGFLSGLVGIGGGIFLAPIMYNLRWGKAKEIAGICCFFILFNSLSGLLGQFQKESTVDIIPMYWILFVVVFIGGQIGSRLGSNKLKPRHIQLLTSFLILFVSLRILFFS
jgi:hypothetical protein